MPTTTNFGWTTPADTDLVKDGAAAIRTLAGNIDTSLVDLKGGTTGQVLAKASNTDLDFTWASDASGIPATIVDAKGDIIAATAADTVSRLAVGANNTVLTADSSTATGLKWATPSAGGITLLSTTTLSGASTTISSISGDYNYLYGIVTKCTNDTADGFFELKPNNTTAQYSAGVRKSGTSTSETFSTNNAAMPLSLNAVVRRNDTDNNFSFFIYDYTNTDTAKWKNFFIFSSFVHSGGTYVRAGSTAGAITGQAAITSLVFANSGGSFLEGTVQLYGVK